MSNCCNSGADNDDKGRNEKGPRGARGNESDLLIGSLCLSSDYVFVCLRLPLGPTRGIGYANLTVLSWLKRRVGEIKSVLNRMILF